MRSNYLMVCCLTALLVGCDQQTAETESETASAPDQVEAPVAIAPTESPSPYYALRPADDSWPADVEGVKPAKNLLANNYYIVLDGSGSMAATTCAEGSDKMTVAKQAIANFAQQIPSDANIALYSFDRNGTKERLPLASKQTDAFFAQVKAIQPGSNTPLKTAMTQGYRSLQAQAVKQLGYGEYHLVVVTDGIATEGESPNAIIDTILQQSPIVIHSIGFCIDENHALNQPGMTFYTAADSAEALQQGLQKVLAEAVDFSTDHF